MGGQYSTPANNQIKSLPPDDYLLQTIRERFAAKKRETPPSLDPEPGRKEATLVFPGGNSRDSGMGSQPAQTMGASSLQPNSHPSPMLGERSSSTPNGGPTIRSDTFALAQQNFSVTDATLETAIPNAGRILSSPPSLNNTMAMNTYSQQEASREFYANVTGSSADPNMTGIMVNNKKTMTPMTGSVPPTMVKEGWSDPLISSPTTSVVVIG